MNHRSSRRPALAALFAAFMLLLSGTAPLGAQRGAPGAIPVAALQEEPGPEDAGQVDAYLLTMGPGEVVWEKFGHNALLFHDPATGRADVYNWGIFSFEQEDFFRRLLFGHMRYMVARTTLDRTVSAYRAADRTIWARPLRLSPDQIRELEEAARTAALPENRNYDYDPFLDNCSSRVRDLLDRVLDGRIRAATDTVATGTTFRSHTRRLLGRVTWAHAGIMVGLGAGTDERLTAWDEMFLPMRMDAHLADLTVDRGDETVALAGPADTLFLGDRPPAPAEVPGFALMAPVAGVGLGGLLVLLAMLAGRGRRGPAHAFAWLGSGASLVAGALGLVIVGAWSLTDHWYAHANENLLQLEPLSLALVVLVPLAILTGRAFRAARWAAWTVTGLAVLGAVLQVLPAFDQANGEVIAVALPVHLGLAAGLEVVRVSR